MTLDGLDFGADFALLAVGQEPVTVRSVDPDTGAEVLATEPVPAVQCPLTRDNTGARGGEVGVTSCEWWLRADALGFTLKPRDQVVQASGAAWSLDSVEEVAGALVRCPATKTR